MGKDIDSAELFAEEAGHRGRAHTRLAAQLVIATALCAAMLVTCSYMPVLLA